MADPPEGVRMEGSERGPADREGSGCLGRIPLKIAGLGVYESKNLKPNRAGSEYFDEAQSRPLGGEG